MELTRPLRKSLTTRILASIAPLAVVAWIEWGRRTGINVPVPFLLLHAAVVATALAGGFVGGVIAGASGAAYVVFASTIGFGPSSLTGGSVQVALGCTLYFASGALTGLVREHRDRLLVKHLDYEEVLKTRVKAATLEIEHAHQALREAAKMQALGQLTGGVAHEFNNMLTPIIGNATLLSRAPALAAHPELREQARQIEAAGERVSALVRQMLTFSRRDQKDTHSVIESAAQVDAALSLLRPMLPTTIKVNASVDANSASIVGNPVDVQQAIINLCINARDAIDGTGQIEVQCESEFAGSGHCDSCGAPVSGQWCAFRVTDSGSGITPDVISRMFEPFFTTKMSGDGTGMGMAMVHGISHAAGGHIQVRSDLNEGTSVSILWPIADGPAAVSSPAEPAAAHGSKLLRGHCILLVDDEPANVQLFKRYLQAAGADVLCCTRPEEALQKLREPNDTIDLLVTDLAMPDLDGATLLTRARALRPRLPVIVCTGYGGSKQAHEIANLPAVTMLQKPIQMGALAEAAHALLT